MHYACLDTDTFPQKSPIIRGSLAKRDLQLKVSYASSPSCMNVATPTRFPQNTRTQHMHTHIHTLIHAHTYTHTYMYDDRTRVTVASARPCATNVSTPPVSRRTHAHTSTHSLSLAYNYKFLLQNIVSFVGLFCKRDL